MAKWGRRRRGIRATEAGRGGEVEGVLHHDRHGAGGSGGDGQGELDVDGDIGILGMIHDRVLGDDGHRAVVCVQGAEDFPGDGGRVGRDAAINLAIEVLDDLQGGAGTTTFPAW